MAALDSGFRPAFTSSILIVQRNSGDACCSEAGMQTSLGKISHVIKRDGAVRDFDAAKITHALERAGQSTGELTLKAAREVTERGGAAPAGCFGRHHSAY